MLYGAEAEAMSENAVICGKPSAKFIMLASEIKNDTFCE